MNNFEVILPKLLSHLANCPSGSLILISHCRLLRKGVIAGILQPADVVQAPLQTCPQRIHVLQLSQVIYSRCMQRVQGI